MKSDESTKHSVMAIIQKLVLMSLPSDACLLCGGKQEIVGIFMPTVSEVWGAPPGKVRYIRYCLCSECYKMPDITERAEKIIRHELSGGGINYAE